MVGAGVAASGSVSLTAGWAEVRRMLPEGDPDADGLTPAQLRWLVGVGLAVGLGFVLLVVGLTAASHLYGIGGGPEGPPDATVDVRSQSVADGVAANLTYRGREAANPVDLVVSVDGEVAGTWGDLGGEVPGGLVAPGSGLHYRDVEPGEEVRIHWEGDDDERVLLGRGTVEAVSEG